MRKLTLTEELVIEAMEEVIALSESQILLLSDKQEAIKLINQVNAGRIEGI